jgi:hypothetical protein
MTGLNRAWLAFLLLPSKIQQDESRRRLWLQLQAHDDSAAFLKFEVK